MNRPIRVMAVGCLLMFLALMVNANYVQFIAADELNADNANRRTLNDEFSRERGPILVGDEPVARSVASDDAYEFQRTYSQPQLYAHLTGYYSYIYGARDVEQQQNSLLSGSDPRLFVNRVIDLVGSEQPKGGSVTLTIDPRVQRAAYQGLTDLAGNSTGAAVAIDPQTGAILAMVSVPSYDPNELASHNFDKVKRAWDDLNDSPANPLRDRSREEIYPPGSTFKLVTAAAALSDGYDPDTMVDGSATLSFKDTSYQLVNESGGNCGADRITLTQALAVSCNVAFGSIGDDLGEGKLRDQAEAFGFGDSDVIADLPAATSQFTGPDRDPLDASQTALTAIGQLDVAASPLQMAMVVAGIANGGTVMRPYVVAETRAPDLDLLETTSSERLHEAVSPDVAAELTEMMVAVVEPGGTGGSAAIEGVPVAAKTGTAQSDADRKPYAWFVSFAPADDPQIAVAVFVQDATGVARGDVSGGRLAGPIAKAMMLAVLSP